jgi:hypothetical protein
VVLNKSKHYEHIILIYWSIPPLTSGEGAGGEAMIKPGIEM